ncbi:prepilin peptidase [Pantoea conspicua]|nr:A24 family peptidase [Pantoea conspicua]
MNPLQMAINAVTLIVGSALGSFIALASHRYSPTLSPARWFGALCSPGSQCDCCHHRLLWRDNLPLISWPALKGKCRYCRQPFSRCSLMTEGLIALLCLLVVNTFDRITDCLFIIASSCLLLLLAAIDRRHLCLPDPLNYMLLWLGLTHALTTGSEAAAITGGLAGYCTLWLLGWGYRLCRGRDGLGYGDMKLFAALGSCCGWQVLPWIAVGATSLALGNIVIGHWRGSTELNNSPLPFGPFLAIAGWVMIVLQMRFTLL